MLLENALTRKRQRRLVVVVVVVVLVGRRSKQASKQASKQEAGWRGEGAPTMAEIGFAFSERDGATEGKRTASTAAVQ